MVVNWTVKARRGVRASIARRLGVTHRDCVEAAPESRCPPAIKSQLDILEKILKKAFDGAESITVNEQMLGFRRRENLWVLLVEVFGEERCGAYVVKIGLRKELKKEFVNWQCCLPERLRHDLVLLPLEEPAKISRPRKETKNNTNREHEALELDSQDDDELISLIYGDAHQFIGVNQIVTLEKAVLESILRGSPQLDSVGFVLNELYERLGHLLYIQAYDDGPGCVPVDEYCDIKETDEKTALKKDGKRNSKKNGQKNSQKNSKKKGKKSKSDAAENGKPISGDGFIFEFPELMDKLRDWENGSAFHLRKLTNERLQNHTRATQYIDPVDYLNYIRGFVAWKDVDGKIHSPEHYDNNDYIIPIPSAAEVVPKMARGAAHGDLHGRNVLVGLIRGRVLWPTVFDYEDMSPFNYIGWDFVKMETELKIRAYPDIFNRPLTDPEDANPEENFVESVQKFERRLAAKTEEHRRNNDWPRAPFDDAPEVRLMWLLLELRRLADLHLGRNLGRAGLWLEEYYFLLACYGVCTVRFTNLQDKERIGAYVSAGVAAARLTWPRELENRARS